MNLSKYVMMKLLLKTPIVYKASFRARLTTIRALLTLFFWAFILVVSPKGIANEAKLDRCYWITYGNPQTSMHVLEYFSFRCPHCIYFIKKEFPSIEKELIANNQIFWIFHPFPMDLLTIQAMFCLQQLSPKEKQRFFKMIIEKIENSSPKMVIHTMKQEMKTLHKKELPLESIDFLKKTSAFQNAFEFMAKTSVHHVPTLEINGVMYHDKPTKKFLEKVVEQKIQDKTAP